MVWHRRAERHMECVIYTIEREKRHDEQRKEEILDWV